MMKLNLRVYYEDKVWKVFRADVLLLQPVIVFDLSVIEQDSVSLEEETLLIFEGILKEHDIRIKRRQGSPNLHLSYLRLHIRDMKAPENLLPVKPPPGKPGRPRKVKS